MIIQAFCTLSAPDPFPAEGCVRNCLDTHRSANVKGNLTCSKLSLLGVTTTLLVMENLITQYFPLRPSRTLREKEHYRSDYHGPNSASHLACHHTSSGREMVSRAPPDWCPSPGYCTKSRISASGPKCGRGCGSTKGAMAHNHPTRSGRAHCAGNCECDVTRLASRGWE